MGKVISLKRFVILITLFIVVLGTQGCAPKGNPEEVINKYFQSVKDSKYTDAYDLLTDKTKESLSLKDFKLWQEQTKEIVEFLDFKSKKVESGKDIALNGITYPHYVMFDVEEINKEYYLGQEQTDVARHYVVADNGNWRLFRNPDIKQALANNYMSLGAMYIDGRGKEQDVKKAAENFGKALETDPELIDAHYSLGVTYMIMGKYDDSIREVTMYLEKSKDNEGKSEALNVIGLAYKSKGEFIKAKEAFEQSIAFNPENEFAKRHIESVTR